MRFPGRVRVLGDAALGASLMAPPDGVEWVGLGTGMVLGAACGTALCEARRGGEVLVLAGADALTALTHAPLAQGLSNLSVVAITAGHAAIAPSDRARTVLGPDGGIRIPEAAQTASRRADAGAAPAWLRRREWPPVQLASLGRSGSCPWPQAAGLPIGAQLQAAVRVLAAGEPALLVAHDQAPWNRAALSLQDLMALAQIAGEGRRVVVGISPALLVSCAAELVVISRRGLALKLLCPWPGAGAASILPQLHGPGPLASWWVQGSADPAEAEALLAQLLVHEDPALLLYDDAPPDDALAQAEAYPRAQAWTPGAGRLVATGDQALVICSGVALRQALALRARLQAQGITVAVFQCTSLAPLPLSGLRGMVARWCQTHAATTMLCLDPDGGAVARALAATLDVGVPVASGLAEAEDVLRAACRQ